MACNVPCTTRYMIRRKGATGFSGGPNAGDGRGGVVRWVGIVAGFGAVALALQHHISPRIAPPQPLENPLRLIKPGEPQLLVQYGRCPVRPAFGVRHPQHRALAGARRKGGQGYLRHLLANVSYEHGHARFHPVDGPALRADQ